MLSKLIELGELEKQSEMQPLQYVYLVDKLSALVDLRSEYHDTNRFKNRFENVFLALKYKFKKHMNRFFLNFH